jgi:hypothetical protein
MGYAPRALLAGGLGFAVSFLVACGGGANLLSGNQSANLNGQLDDVSSAVDAGHCGGATRALASFSKSVGGLPPKVSPTLRANLVQGASTVGQLAQQDCRTTSTSPSTSSTTTAPTTTTTTTTPSTSSTSTTSTSTTTPSTTSTTPATSTTPTGTTSTTQGTGGAGIGGGTTSTGGSGGGGSSGGGATGQ